MYYFTYQNLRFSIPLMVGSVILIAAIITLAIGGFAKNPVAESFGLILLIPIMICFVVQFVTDQRDLSQATVVHLIEQPPLGPVEKSPLQQLLIEYNFDATVHSIEDNQFLTRAYVQLNKKVKIDKIMALEDSFGLYLQSPNLLIYPRKDLGLMVFETPKTDVPTVHLDDMLGVETDYHIPLLFGVNKESGEPFIKDLAELPHLLVGGATNSGKSTLLNALIRGIKAQRPNVEFIMVDPKMGVEFGEYEQTDTVIKDPADAAEALTGLVDLMKERYRLLAAAKVKKIWEYPGDMPPVVLVIDELSDLMMSYRSEVEDSITRLGQMARAVGILIIAATQRPSADVVTGPIKANLLCRVGGLTADATNSRIIIDQNGCERLLGYGDMLYSVGDTLIRFQATYCK